METSRLRYFCTIAETGSLTKSSKILSISHSGLSKAISALETELGYSLFQPQGRGLEITEQGKWFYTKALEVLKIVDEIKTKKTEPTQVVRIGLSEVIAVLLSSSLIHELKSPASLIETDIGIIENKLANQELEFGITFSIAPRPEFDYLELGKIKLNSFARVDLLNRFKPEEIPYIVPATDLPFNPLGYKLRDGWPQDIPRNTLYSVSSFAMALSLLQAGEGAVYMPDFAASILNQNISLKNEIKKIAAHKRAETQRTLYLVKLKSAEETAAMKRTAKAIRKVCL